MNIKIEFIENISELSIPLIKLTNSKNGKTGTATFLFIKPSIFQIKNFSKSFINGLYLIWENKKIYTTDLSLIFKDGQPFIIKAIFIFKNSNEWFNFLSFMTLYSKETGLTFSDTTYP